MQGNASLHQTQLSMEASDSDSTLVLVTSEAPTVARKLSSHSKATQPRYIDLTGEELMYDPPDLTNFHLSDEDKDMLLRCETPQQLCRTFFSKSGLKMRAFIRIDGKNRFSRIEIEGGEYVFEESVASTLLGRSVASLKAVRSFNPGLVHAWLQKYRKTKEVLKGRLL